MEKENICIPDGIKNVGLSLRYTGAWSAGLLHVGLLNIGNTTSVNPEKDYLFSFHIRCTANNIKNSGAMLLVE